MEEKELWMNKLKEKLADYSEPAPASGWEQLEKELMPPVEKKIYPYRKWMMAAAAIIILAVVSSVSLYFLGTPAADDILIFPCSINARYTYVSITFVVGNNTPEFIGT